MIFHPLLIRPEALTRAARNAFHTAMAYTRALYPQPTPQPDEVWDTLTPELQDHWRKVTAAALAVLGIEVVP